MCASLPMRAWVPLTAWSAVGRALVLTTAAMVSSPGVAAADDVLLSGVGTASVDGVLSPGEWTGAATVTFTAFVPEGGTTPVTLHVMNDRVNLYLALSIVRSSVG